MLNKIINFFTFYYLARRYLIKQAAEVKAMERNREAFYAEAWKFVADQAGAAIKPLDANIFRITKGPCSVLVFSHYSPFDNPVTQQLAENKKVVYNLLSENDVPIPRYINLKNLDISAAKSFMSKIGGPLVVKPTYGTGAGSGITTNVTGMRRLCQAIAWSRTFCPDTLLEEQIKGDNYRLLFLDGELLDCVIRRPPTVVGDGESSILALIRQENESRVNSGAQLAQSLIHIDLDTKNTLKAQGMNLRTRPEKDQIVKVKDVINPNRAKDNENQTTAPCESLILMCRTISRAIGARLVGIDIITNNLDRDLRDTGGVVIEVNTNPSHYFHQFTKGCSYLVALKVLEKALEDNKSDYLEALG